jgi:hypothetical protein
MEWNEAMRAVKMSILTCPVSALHLKTTKFRKNQALPFIHQHEEMLGILRQAVKTLRYVSTSIDLILQKFKIKRSKF